MIPGELFIRDGEIELNAGRKTVTLSVANTGDRPIQVDVQLVALAGKRMVYGFRGDIMGKL
jgi:urease subunit beta